MKFSILIVILLAGKMSFGYCVNPEWQDCGYDSDPPPKIKKTNKVIKSAIVEVNRTCYSVDRPDGFQIYFSYPASKPYLSSYHEYSCEGKGYSSFPIDPYEGSYTSD